MATHGEPDPLPTLSELLDGAEVVSLPMSTRFRGQTRREAVLFRGPSGATEFSPFAEYEDDEAASWLAAAIDFGWNATPPVRRDRIPVNATLPAVPAEDVDRVLDRFAGCRTVKVKVAERGQTLGDDIARVRAARDHVGPEGRVRVDANAGWNVDEAERAIHSLAGFDLEYIEQPCETVAELLEIGIRVKHLGIPIAADESVRKAEDPLEVARRDAADILVIKAQPLGGLHRALRIVETAGLPVVVSSAIDTSVGIAMGAHLAGSIPELPYDCGLGTVSLLGADVVRHPLVPESGSIPVERPELDDALLHDLRADRTTHDWWIDRVVRCYRVLEHGEP